jgi:hypothetical protein
MRHWELWTMALRGSMGMPEWKKTEEDFIKCYGKRKRVHYGKRKRLRYYKGSEMDTRENMCMRVRSQVLREVL